MNKPLKELTYGSLFSGIGGIDLGLDRAGWRCAWQVEIDRDCRRVLERHWPETERHTDVRSVRGPKLSEEDKQEAVRFYDQGFSLAPIAAHFGVSRQSMWDVLHRRTTMRPQQRYGADNHFYRGGVRASDHAQNLLEEALERGLVERQTVCQKCGGSPRFKDGRNGVQAHHPDYNRPLEVIWLCQPCHHEWHKNAKPVPRREGGDANGTTLKPVDLVCGGFP